VDVIRGGWEFGSIVTLMDGLPTAAPGSGNSDGLNQNSNSCNATGVSPFLAHPTAQLFWNINAFNCSDPALYYSVGNIGLNVLRTPGTRQWDFLASKNFRIKERHNVQFRFEAFNFPNHPNWNTPSSAVHPRTNVWCDHLSQDYAPTAIGVEVFVLGALPAANNAA
jgi:hypothetical protein